jgi:DNA-binding beta-propeller fold protein YncE
MFCSRVSRVLGASCAVALLVSEGSVRGFTAPAPPVAMACTFSPASPAVVALATTISGIVIDDACQYVYLTNTPQNRVEVYSLQTQSFEAPIAVGPAPIGLDLTPDGTTLYVANSGENKISKVNLAARVELERITVPPPSFLSETPYSIAIGSHGRALVSTRTTGSSGGRLMDLILSTGQMAHRTDINQFGGITDRTRLSASDDRGTIAIVQGGTSGGNTSIYHSASNTFDPEVRLNSDVTDVALGAAGSPVLVSRLLDQFTVVDAGLMTGNLFVPTASRGVAVDPDRSIGYRSIGTNIEVLNLSTFQVIGQFPLGDSVNTNNPFNFVGRMDLSRDGTLLAVITNTGLSFVRTDSAAPLQNFNFVRNHRFDSGLNRWLPFGVPNPADLISHISDGVFEFALQNGGGEGGVFQNTGQAFPASAILDAQFSLGNSSGEPRNISVVVGNASLTDARICTFVVPPGAPLRAYRMQLKTLQAWSGTLIRFATDTAGASGFNRLDNVSLQYNPSLSVSGTVCTPPPPPPPTGSCGVTPSSKFVTLSGALSPPLIDDTCTFVYIANGTLNRIEVYSLQTLSFERPIQVGSQPKGMEFSADGSLLYVANMSAQNFSLVDLAQRAEVRKIPFPIPGGSLSMDTPLALARANTGRMIFASTSGKLMELDLATDQSWIRTDGPSNGTFSSRAHMEASGDRSTIVLIDGGSTGGALLKYTAASNSFGAPKPMGQFMSDIAVNRTGSQILASPGTFVLDSAFNLSGTVIGSTGFGGVAIDPRWPVGYRAEGSNLEVLNLATFLEGTNLPLGDTVTTASSSNYVGRMDISPDGLLVAVTTDHGLSLVAPPVAAPQQSTFVTNGNFSGGLTGWQTFATPDSSYIDASVSGGVLQFNRLAAPGGGNQAVVFQQTGVALPPGSPVQAQFQLGNSSSSRKRVSVLLLNYDFSDLYVCTFWIPPNSPLAQYRMRTHTTRSWSNAAIYFYAASDVAGGGYNRIDNVSLTYDPNLPADMTECLDPWAPTAVPGAPDGPELVVNGSFQTGTLASWSTFGTLTAHVTNGVAEFARETATPPAGVLLQPTLQPAAAGDILTASFDLGNTGTVRKRVTIILHDNDFSDLSACTFWLPPGQVPATYVMRAYATEAWTNATFSVYAATVGADGFVLLDNVTLRRTPSSPIAGTECVEPGSSGGQAPGGSQLSAPSRDPGTGAPSETADARALRPSRSQQSTVERLLAEDLLTGTRSEWFDLSNAQGARLSLESWLIATGGHGDLQISTNGTDWTLVLSLLPSDGWTTIDLDLDPWIGQPVAFRFLPRGADVEEVFVWRVRHFRIGMNLP